MKYAFLVAAISCALKFRYTNNKMKCFNSHSTVNTMCHAYAKSQSHSVYNVCAHGAIDERIFVFLFSPFTFTVKYQRNSV